MSAGKVCTGFSKPYVALYAAASGAVTYSKGQVLARGVDVSLEPAVSDTKKFYANNGEAESVEGKFKGGTMKLTVDGLLDPAAALIMGLPNATTEGWTKYGDEMKPPYVGVGYIARYMSGDTESFVPTIVRKTKFAIPTDKAATEEDGVKFQTSSLESEIFRDDSTTKDWKWIGAEKYTEEAAEAMIKTALGITTGA